MAGQSALLCLAGEQVMPNAIAARQLGVARLLVLHTAHEQLSHQPARRLEAWWEGVAGHACVLRELADLSDLAGLQATILEAMHRKYRWIVNVTGGTKLMSLAAVSAAIEREARVCYVDTPRQRLLWLGEEPSGEPLTATFHTKELLELHGHPVQTLRQPQAAELAAAAVLAEQRAWVGEWATRCQQLASPEQVTLPPAREHPAALFDAGVLHRDGDRAVLTALGWELVRGEWLEVLAVQALRAAGAQRVALEVTTSFVAEPGTYKAEADALGVFGCRLVVVECKTGRSLAGDMFANVAGLAASLGGSMAIPALVWAPVEPDSVSESTLTRHAEMAADHGVLLHFGWSPDQFVADLCARLANP